MPSTELIINKQPQNNVTQSFSLSFSVLIPLWHLRLRRANANANARSRQGSCSPVLVALAGLLQYTKLYPQVLVIASSAMAGQRRGHQFLSPFHAAVLSSTNATSHELRRVFDIDSWRKTALFPYDTLRSAPDTSFDEHGKAGSAPSHQWYTKIDVAYQNLTSPLVGWRKCNEELDWGLRNNLVEPDLPNQIARLNRMHREICGIDDLMHIADGIGLFFRYRRFWTVDKMRRAAPFAVSILGLLQDLQKVCKTNNSFFEDRAPFLAYKVVLFLGQHRLRGL